MTFIEYCSQPAHKDSLYRIPIDVVQRVEQEEFETAFKTIAEEIAKNYYERGWWDSMTMNRQLAILNDVADEYRREEL